MPDESIFGLVTGLPDIRHIALNCAPSGFFSWLSTDTLANPLWPRLERITLGCIGNDEASVLCRMVSHRASIGTRKLRLNLSLEDIREDTIE